MLCSSGNICRERKTKLMLKRLMTLHLCWPLQTQTTAIVTCHCSIQYWAQRAAMCLERWWAAFYSALTFTWFIIWQFPSLSWLVLSISMSMKQTLSIIDRTSDVFPLQAHKFPRLSCLPLFSIRTSVPFSRFLLLHCLCSDDTFHTTELSFFLNHYFLSSTSETAFNCIVQFSNC